MEDRSLSGQRSMPSRCGLAEHLKQHFAGKGFGLGNETCGVTSRSDDVLRRSGEVPRSISAPDSA